MALQVVHLAGLAEVSLVPVVYLEVFLAVSLVEKMTVATWRSTEKNSTLNFAWHFSSDHFTSVKE
jgi:hypothetical protein